MERLSSRLVSDLWFPRCARPLVCGLAIAAVVGLAVAPCRAASDEQIHQARTTAIAWLIRQQRQDGSWSGPAGTETAATAGVLDGFRTAGVNGYPYLAGLAWLANARAASVDSLARQIAALHGAGIGVTALTAQLDEWRNHSPTWGTYEAFDVSLPDTALAVTALTATGDIVWSESLCAIVRAQRSGHVSIAGSWNYSADAWESGPGAVVPTAASIEALKPWVVSDTVSAFCSFQPTLGTAVTRGVDWLTGSARKSDGGFGEGQISTVLETAAAYEALAQVDPANLATVPALDYLVQRQQPDGSWNGDVLTTAFVLRALPAPPAPLPDSDGDGIPDAVELVLGRSLSTRDGRLPSADGLTTSRTTAAGSEALTASAGTWRPAIVIEGTRGDGDLNSDGVVDAADIAIAERLALGLLGVTPAPGVVVVTVADYDRMVGHGDVAPRGAPDNRIDAADVARLRRIVLGYPEP